MNTQFREGTAISSEAGMLRLCEVADKAERVSHQFLVLKEISVPSSIGRGLTPRRVVRRKSWERRSHSGALAHSGNSRVITILGMHLWERESYLSKTNDHSNRR